MKQITPALNKSSFTCPHCHANAAQRWYQGVAKVDGPAVSKTVAGALGVLTEQIEMVVISGKETFHAGNMYFSTTGLKFSKCYSCSAVAVWIGNRLAWPATEFEVTPNPDMPATIKPDFEEAASIVNLSPRGAAALLRLALQKLINSLVGKPTDINVGIQALVDAGLPKPVQQACDYVRIVGNDAVHPGQIDIKDDVAMATRLFQLLNLIVTHTISFQRTMAEIYPLLPANKLQGIEDRAKGAARGKAAQSPLAPEPAQAQDAEATPKSTSEP